jgi:hypothetical protein
LVVSVPALAFALFGWSQTVQPLFGIYTRYVCIFGSLGAIITGTLLANEGLAMKKALAGKHVAQCVRDPTLDFLVMLEKEEEKHVTT